MTPFSAEREREASRGCGRRCDEHSADLRRIGGGSTTDSAAYVRWIGARLAAYPGPGRDVPGRIHGHFMTERPGKKGFVSPGYASRGRGRRNRYVADSTRRRRGYDAAMLQIQRRCAATPTPITLQLRCARGSYCHSLSRSLPFAFGATCNRGRANVGDLGLPEQWRRGCYRADSRVVGDVVVRSKLADAAPSSPNAATARDTGATGAAVRIRVRVTPSDRQSAGVVLRKAMQRDRECGQLWGGPAVSAGLAHSGSCCPF